MNLFQNGDFTSHAGLPLTWKIECDAITESEWQCLAQIIMMYQHEPFSLSLIHISEPTRRTPISYAVFSLKK